MRRNYITIPTAMFFNQFVVSPFRSFLVLVLDELGYTAYEIGLIIAIGDVAALLGAIIGAAVSDLIGRKNSSFLGRSIYATGMFLMYLFFHYKRLFVAAFALAQVGLMRARAAMYILVGETSSSRVSFSAYSFAINDVGGFLGLLLFVKALDGLEAVVIFRRFMPLRTIAATISAIAIFFSIDTAPKQRGELRITKNLLKYLLLITFTFFGVAIFRTFSPLYAKYYIGISDQLRGKISMLGIAVEAIYYFLLSRTSMSSVVAGLIGVGSYSSLALLVVLRPTEISAIIGFGFLRPGFTAFFRPALIDFDISVTDPKARGRLVSLIFMFRRLGLTGGRITGARLFVLDPVLVMITPMITITLGLLGIIALTKGKF